MALERHKLTRNPNSLVPSSFHIVKDVALYRRVVPGPFVGDSVEGVAEIPARTGSFNPFIRRDVLECCIPVAWGNVG
jgi:hypothetical protein